MHEIAHESNSVRSAWGPQSMFSNDTSNFFKGLANTLLAETPSAMVGFADWINDVLQYTHPAQYGTPFQEDWLDEGDTYWNNIAAWQSFKQADDITFDKSRAFWWNAGSAIGSVAQMLITRNLSTGLAKAGTGAGMWSLSDDAANAFGRYMGSGTMAITAAESFDDAARESGISEEARMLLYGPALVGSYAIERWGSNILDDGVAQFYTKRDLKEFVKTGIRTSVDDYGVATASDLTEEQLKATGKKIWQNIYAGGKSAGGRVIDLSKRGISYVSSKSPIAVRAAWEEGMEEVMEGRFHNSLQVLHDMYQHHTKHHEDPNRYTYVQDNDGFYRWDKKNQQKRRVSEETWNKGVNAQKTRPGEGMFGEWNPEQQGFLNNLGTRVKEGTTMDFVLGAFAGGTVSTITNTFHNIKNGKRDKQDQALAYFVTNGRGNEMRRIFDQMYKTVTGTQGHFGPMDITPEGGIVDPNDPNSISMHEFGYRTALKELEEAEKLFDRTGLRNSDLLDEMMQSKEGATLVQEAYANAKQQRTLHEEITALEAEIAETTDEHEIGRIQKEIDDRKREKGDLMMQLEDIKSGQRLKENVADHRLRDLSSNENLYAIDSSGEQYVPSSSQIKSMNNRFDKERSERIEAVKESKQTRAKLEQEIGPLTKAITDTKTDPKSTEDLNTFFGKLSDIQKTASEVGLSEANSLKLIESLEGYRQSIIENVDQYFDESQVKAAKESAEITEQDYKQALLSELPSAKEGTEARTAYDTMNNIESAIDSFNVEQPGELKVGDFAQWTSGEGSTKQQRFDSPRKIIGIETDKEGKKWAMVEGTDTAIPYDELHDPNYQGRIIRGSVPVKFDEQAFRTEFYDTFIDEQGNRLSISATMMDMLNRNMNDEDFQTIEALKRAINNNQFAAYATLGLSEMDKSDKFDIGTLAPSAEAGLTGKEAEGVINDLGRKRALLDQIIIKQKLDINDKKNREGRLRYNDYQIRRDILPMVYTIEEFDPEARKKLIDAEARLNDAFKAVKEEFGAEGLYVRTTLDEIDPVLIEAESIIHKELNGPNGEKIISKLGKAFRSYKRISPDVKIQDYLEAGEFVKNDFEDSYTHAAFAAPSKMDARPIDQAREQFARIYFMNHMQMLQRMDPKLFFSHLNGIVTEMKEDNGFLPSFEQAKVIQQSVSFLNDPNNSLMLAIESNLTDKNPDDGSYLGNRLLGRSLFIRGFAGTGKTSLVVKAAANIYSNMLGKKINIATSAPSKTLQKTINSNLDAFRGNQNEPGMDISELIEYLGLENSSAKNLDLIVIDEASSINKSEMNQLTDALRNMPERRTDLKVLFLGDQSQMTSIEESKYALLPVERRMERTMPTTEVFRSGAADISNLQTAFRNSIFNDTEPILPKGTYDKTRNNGLEYFGGTKKEIYDRFADDINSEDTFKNNNTILITYSNQDRDAALNYLQKKLKDPNASIDDKVMTIEKGEAYVQGLEFPRIIVAIEKADAQHLYNRAVLTAATRAMKADQEHQGYALLMSTEGFSEEGAPVLVETKTATDEDYSRMKDWIQSITGEKVDSNTTNNRDSDSELQTVSKEEFERFKGNLKSIRGKGKIEFNNDGFIVNDAKYRYKINNKGVRSVTERLKAVTKKSKSESEHLNTAHADRGSAVHRIVEAYLLSTQKGPNGKLFTKGDIDAIRTYLNKYNDEIISWNETAKQQSRLDHIDIQEDELTFATNEFVNDVLENVAKPIAARLNGEGKFSLPETIVGIFYNDIAGTIDIVDQVGMENGVPVVDVYDIKTLTEKSHEFFADSDEDGNIDLGTIEMPSGIKLPANKLNKALSQLGTYKAIAEKGDEKTGLKPFKVRNVFIIKSMITGDNTVVPLSEEDFVMYDSNSEQFDVFAQYGNDTVGNFVIPSAKGKKTYNEEHSLLGKVIINGEASFKNKENATSLVTGVYSTAEGNEFIELNNDPSETITMDQFDNNWSIFATDKNINPDENPDEQTVYKRSAVSFSNGDSFVFGSASSYVQDGRGPRDNDHAKFKIDFLKEVASDLGSKPSSPDVDIQYHTNFDLLDDDGNLTPFENVLLVVANDKTISDRMVKIARKTDWGKGKNQSQLVEEIKKRGFHILGTMPNPDSDFNQTESEVDYFNEVEYQKTIEKIKNGFEGDEFKANLVAWHTHLAGLRRMGAEAVNQLNTEIPGSFSSTNVGTVKLRNILPGTVKYSKTENSWTTIKDNLKKKGFIINKPVWNPAHHEKTNEDGSITNVATWSADVFKVNLKTDKSNIILRSPAVSQEHLDNIKSDLEELKSRGSTLADTNRSIAYRFIQQNRSQIIDPSTQEISSELEGLDEFLVVKNKSQIDINLHGKTPKPDTILASLGKVIDFIKTALDGKNPLVGRFTEVIDFTTGNDKQLVVPADQEQKLQTLANDVHNFGLQIKSNEINTSDVTGVVGTANDGGEFDNPLLKLMKKMNNDPNQRSEMGEIHSKKSAYDDTSENAHDSEMDVYGEDNYFTYAKNFFGDVSLMNVVKKDVAHKAIHFSNWNRDLNEPIASLPEMIHSVMNYYKSIVDQDLLAMNLTTELGEGIETIADVSGKTAHLINPDEFTNYAYYVLGSNEDVVKSIIQKLFPSIDLKDLRMRDIGEYLQSKIEGDEDIKMENTNSQSNVMDNLNERDYSETLSSFVHLHLNHVPLIEHSLDEEGNEIAEESQSRKVDSKVIHKSLVDAAQMSHWIIPGVTDGMTKMERFGHHFQTMAFKAGIGTATYDNIMSIYKVFFSDSKSDMSHKYIRDNSVPMPGVEKSDLEFEFDPEIVKVKGYASDNLLSALYSHFASVASSKSTDLTTKDAVVKKGDEDAKVVKKYTQKQVSLAIGSHIAQAIKSRITNTLFGINDLGLSASEDVKNKLVGDNKIFDVTPIGIHDRWGNMLIKVTKDKSGAFSKFEIPGDVRPGDIKQMLNVLGVKELVYNSTIASYMNKEVDNQNVDPEDKKTRSKLAEIVGIMMFTGRASVDPNWVGIESLGQYFEKNNYDRESVESLNDDSTIDATGLGSDLYKPTDAYYLIKNLGKLQSDVQLHNHSRHYYSIEGKKIYRDTNGATLNLMFPSGDIGGQKPSAGVKNFISSMIEAGINPDNALFKVNESGEVVTLNEVLDPNSDWSIDDVSIMGGTKTEFGSVVQGKSMTDHDFADFSFNGMFMEDLLKGRRIQTVKIPYHNTADKSRLPIFTHNFSTKNPFIVNSDKGTVEINQEFKNEQVQKIFDYHNNARIKSISRIARVLETNPELNVSEEIKQGWLADPNALQHSLKEAAGAGVNLVELFRRSGLTNEKDYSIKKINGVDTVVAGTAPTMNVSNQYNWNNYNKINGLEGDELSNAIDGIFRSSHMNAVWLMKDLGVRLHPSLQDRRHGIPSEEEKGPWTPNKALQAFFYAYHFADHYMTQAIQGDVTQYTGIDDLFKRSTGPVAARWSPDTDSPRGMGKTSNIVVVEDIPGEEYTQLRTVFGAMKSKYDHTDGLGLINPISYILMRNSFGGKDLGVIGDGMAKPVYFKNDLNANVASYFKYATLNMTEQTLRNSKLLRDTFFKMVGEDLYNMWDQGSSFEDIAEHVINNNLKGKLKDQVIFASGMKTGQQYVQNFSDPEWSTSLEMDNEYFGIQLNASQDIENTENLAQPSQLNALVGIGAHNSGRVQGINPIKAEIASDGIDGIFKKFSENDVFNKEMFFDYLRKMGISSALKNGEINQFAEMLHNKNINMNLPSLGKVKQQLINRVTAEAIKPKWNGVRMSQAPAFMFTLFEDESGNVFMENEVARHEVPVKHERGLRPMEFYSDESFDVDSMIQTAEEFDVLLDPASEGNVYVKPADVIMPFSYFEQFGFDEYMKIHPDFSYNDAFMFRTSDGKLVNLKKIAEEDLATFLNSEYSKMSQIKKKAAKSGEEFGTLFDTFIQQTHTSPDTALKYIETMKEVSRVINNRVPTSSTSGAFIGEVVGWINDNGNTVYTSAAKNILDGGDYDIDQLNVFFKSISKDGQIKTEHKEGKMNNMFDLLYDYFTDPQNAALFMSPIDLGSNLPGKEYGLKGQVAEMKRNMKG
jgi:hypothetical protein